MIRPVEIRDAADVARIYNQAMKPTIFATCDVRPVSPESRLEWIAKHQGRYPAFVLERDGEVLGWSALNPFSVRPSYPGIAEVSVYIDERHRGTHVGRRLFVHLVQTAIALGFRSLVSLTFEKNSPSIRGLEAAGFRHTGCLEEVAIMREQWENVAWLQLELSADLPLMRYAASGGGDHLEPKAMA